MKSLYIIASNSRAANYGIGTYVKQLVDVLRDSSLKVNMVILYAEGVLEPCVEEVDSIRYFRIASPRIDAADSSKGSVRYYRNVYYFLLPYISKEDEIIFHFNLLQGEELVKRLKNGIKCKTLLTVHYMGWSFSLLGDVAKLKEIMMNPKSDQDKSIKESCEDEQRFIKENFDYVIAIAKHSYNTLLSVYDIPVSKMTIIANGLKDQYMALSAGEKNVIRKSFHFRENEILLIFAGRLDDVKGISYLLKAFNYVLEKNENVRLIVAGDGNYNHCFENSHLYWSRVIYTGFINKEDLYKLYLIADIGIVPSLHEEFGYVALEMIMNGLPVIVNNTTGLSEIIEDGINGLYISIDQNIDQQKETLQSLAERINELIRDSQKRKLYSEEGRSTYKLKYDQSLFKDKMIALYDSLYNK